MRIILVFAVLLFSSEGWAFHEVRSFDESANSGGGAGNYFSGSPRAKRYECTICHVAAEGRIQIGLSSSLNSGSYRPGLDYNIVLRLEGEHRGLESAFNPNTFTAEITDDTGEPVGTFAGTGVEIEKEFTVAIAEGFGNGETEWEFSWRSPEIGVPATLYIAMLDGDGASDKERRFIDPLNDDVATLEIHLCPEGLVCAEPQGTAPDTSPAGCAAAGHSSGLLALGFLLLLWRVRPRKRS